MAERFVQTVKNTVAKALKDKRDVYMALLCIRTTPIDSQIPSPAELLYNRKIRSTLPTQIHNNNPHKDEISARLQTRQSTQKDYYDKATRLQPPLIPGQRVYVQNQTGHKRWAPAKVERVRDEPRSYEVTTQQGKTLRRNRRQLKEASEKRVNLTSTLRSHIMTYTTNHQHYKETKQRHTITLDTHTNRSLKHNKHGRVDKPREDKFLICKEGIMRGRVLIKYHIDIVYS
ncbi:hypothetical protein HOLleu_22781 [Holothuria leucospilota]|uniref:Uncharacterized protein n=1 Tax=Holothuria leucospilota TaxID=206669 RepID=A0A9Q1H518_HOLLE|nr:hypothetical protein HOLleu_22781 [Holothuria leucospilota]